MTVTQMTQQRMQKLPQRGKSVILFAMSLGTQILYGILTILIQAKLYFMSEKWLQV